MMSDIIHALAPIAEVFDNLGILFYVGGSVSAFEHGYERYTHDIDVVADIQEAQAHPLAIRLQGDYYCDAEMIRDAARRRSSCNFIHLGTGFNVDIFLSQDAPYPREQMRRRQLAQFDDTHQFPVSSIEDTILAKVDWYHIGGEISDRQWNDLHELITLRGADLDLAYLYHWAAEIGRAELLDRALTEGGISA